jgi:hypothetical protein
MLEDSQLSGGFSALSSSSMEAIASLDSSTLLSSSFLRDLAVSLQQIPLSSGSTPVVAQTIQSLPTNLILDFDGGVLNPTLDIDFEGGGLQISRNGPNRTYALPNKSNGVNFAAFNGFSSTSNPIATSARNEQILQILAGVREDFARFNVNVIWDDRGVTLPFFDNNSTVAIVTDSSPTLIGNTTGTLLGNSPTPIDANQTRSDVVLAFIPTRLDLLTTSERIRSTIDTISHETGHTFGLRHPAAVDPATNTNTSLSNREIMGTGANNTLSSTNLDSEFTSDLLLRDDKTTYDDISRLNTNLGTPSAPFQNDLVSNQTLPEDADRVPQFEFVPVAGFLSQNGTIDFSGDRDAFRFQVSASGQYTIRENSSAVTPVVSLWDGNGDFISVSNGGKITFDALIGRDYFAVVGSTADQATTFTEANPMTGVINTFRGNLPNGQIGNYALEVGPYRPNYAIEVEIMRESLPNKGLRDFMANKNTLLAETLAKQRFLSKKGLNQHSRNDRARSWQFKTHCC